MFGVPRQGVEPLLQMKAGKMNLQGTTVTADPRKGIITLRKSDDGLMHLLWKERNSGGVEDDLIVFEGDASMRRLEQCQDGYAMLLEFTQTGRKLFFYSQEPRKKGLDWDDTTKEKELLERANGILTGGSAPAAAPAAPAGGAAAPFSADAISSILGNIGTAPAQPAAGAPPGAFSADAISSILGNIGAAGQQQPLSLTEVLRPENAVGAVDSTMDAALREHLPPGGNVPETTAESLTTPQVAQASADASNTAGTSSSAEAMDTEDGKSPPTADKMDES